LRIHISGMSPRMVSHRSRTRISFASLLADGLAASGHEVVRDARIQDDADVVVVGVSSVLSPAATYSVVALGIIADALHRGRPLVLFTDQPNLGNIREAVASVRRDPDRLWSDFLTAKRVIASANFSRDDVMDAIDMLGQDVWPTVMVPVHGWGPQTGLSHKLGIVSEVVKVDISPILVDQLNAIPWWDHGRRAWVWLCEQHYVKSHLSPSRTTWYPIQVKSPANWETLDHYAGARGVFQDQQDRFPGWWTPTPFFAARAGAIYLTGIDEGYLMGAPYYKTVDEIEGLSERELDDLALSQIEHIKDVSWDRATCTSALEAVIGQSTSFAKPGTTRTTS
jgi:hypothetical protein